MPPSPPVEVDVDRLSGELEHLATFSDTPAPSVTRILFTETDLAARAYVKTLMQDAGLDIVEDAVGNIIGRWTGSGKGSVGSGSHCDAIPHAGKYDGTLGVIGGIAAVRALKAVGFEPTKTIDIIMFTSEEPTRFGIGCSGSRLLGGAIEAEALDALVDDDDVTFAQARAAAGYSGDLAGVTLADDAYDFFVELHIEQGPVLEREGMDIGVVNAIAAPASFSMRFSGGGGHAGAVLMPDREDALVPAALLISAAERLARESASDSSVATVGIVEVGPGAVNSIPRDVHLTFDIRDTDLDARQGIIDELLAIADRETQARGVTYELKMINSDPPAITDPRIHDAIEAACERQACSHLSLVSRAYHDALFMARKAPTGMIFVPSKDGISHRPDEYSSPEEMAKGVAVLAETLAALSA